MVRDLDPERWKRIEPIFDRALDLPPAEREAYLDEACAGDDELRAEVEILLTEEARATGPLATDAIPEEQLADLADETGMDADPERIGRYRILGRLGEGGMGIVYLAEQSEPMRRRVAVKVIRRGIDTDQVVNRFEAERQALALLDHPSIAKVLDGGTTEGGRPYFAMEYVDGVPITEYCDREELATAQRLELFSTVCAAVQHAHRKGILHRDLKPSNVLVTLQDDRPTPKVIDFGIAKAVQQRLTEKSLFTEYGQLVGTPEYMSPEQADPAVLDIDTRTDVYSLGVLLYELLTGVLPVAAKELRREGYDAMRRVLLESDPPLPSERLRTLGDEESRVVARSHATDAGTLWRELRGELDWIAMRALERDRERRYGSAFELAADVERHLTDQPVQAGPPSGWYRARKFVRRHRYGVLLAAAVAVSLLVGLGAALWQARIAARESERARAEARRADMVKEFLVDAFSTADPNRNPGGEVRVVDVLAEANEKVAEYFDDEPLMAADTKMLFSDIYTNLGKYDDAERMAEESLELMEANGGALDARIQILYQLGTIHRMNQDYTASRERYERAIALLDERPAGGPWLEGLILRTGHGRLLTMMEDYAGAERAFRSLADELTGEEEFTEQLSAVYSGLAVCLLRQGRLNDAVEIAGRSVDLGQPILGEDHPLILSRKNTLAVLYHELHRFEEAERFTREVMESARRVLGDDHPNTIAVTENLASILTVLGRLDEAVAIQEEVLAAVRGAFGDEHPRTAHALAGLAGTFKEAERYEEALPLLDQAIPLFESTLGAESQKTAWARDLRASILARQGRTSEALTEFRHALAIFEGSIGPDAVDTAKTRGGLGAALIAASRPGEAEPLLRRALEVFTREALEDPAYVGATEYQLGRALAMQGKRAEAAEILESAIGNLEGVEGLPARRREALDAARSLLDSL